MTDHRTVCGLVWNRHLIERERVRVGSLVVAKALAQLKGFPDG